MAVMASRRRAGVNNDVVRKKDGSNGKNKNCDAEIVNACSQSDDGME